MTGYLWIVQMGQGRKGCRLNFPLNTKVPQRRLTLQTGLHTLNH